MNTKSSVVMQVEILTGPKRDVSDVYDKRFW